jgi:drug/metabolite transporter (DMT)-like permease
MWLIAAIITTLCFGTNNAIFKWSTGKGYSKVNIQFFFYFIAFILTLFYGMASDNLDFQITTIVLGGLIGVLNTNGNIQMSKAFEKGPASLTSPIISANAIFPVLSAGLLFHEKISTLQWSGILLILVSAVVIQYTPNQLKINTNYSSWLFRVALAFLSFGVLGVLMKLSSILHMSSLNILISMYGGGSAYLFILNIRGREKIRVSEVKTGALVGILSVAGFSSYFFALETGVASIVFPVISLNCLIVVFAGYILFKEKLRLYQVVGVLSALLGIVLTKI